LLRTLQRSPAIVGDARSGAFRLVLFAHACGETLTLSVTILPSGKNIPEFFVARSISRQGGSIGSRNWFPAGLHRLAGDLLEGRVPGNRRNHNQPNNNMMKVKHTTCSITKTVLALTACASLNAFAGTAGKAVAPAPETDDSLFGTFGIPITGSVDVGWDSRYYFRGLWFADQIAWSGISLSMPLSMISENLTLGFGALYTSTVETIVGGGVPAGTPGNLLDYSELDLTASLTYDLKFMKLGVVYTNYQFFDGFSGTLNNGAAFGLGEYAVKSVPEIGVVASTSQFGVNAYLGYYYDFNIGGSYFEVGADYPVKVLPYLTFVPAVKAGYGLDYYSNGAPENGGLFGGVTSGFTHVLFSLAAPVNLTKTATLTPYVAWNVSGRARQSNNATDNEVFGGVKLSVSF
jgi:hypothetical protein